MLTYDQTAEYEDNAAAAIFKRKCVKNGRALGMKAELKAQFLERIVEGNILCLRNPITRTRNLSEVEIINAMLAKHSQPAMDTLASRTRHFGE